MKWFYTSRFRAIRHVETFGKQHYLLFWTRPFNFDIGNSSTLFHDTFLFLPLSCSVLFYPVPSHAFHEWRQAASLAAARMRQQLFLGCPPSLLKGRYRVSNSSSWLDTLEISGQGQSSKQVNQLVLVSNETLIDNGANTSGPEFVLPCSDTRWPKPQVSDHFLASRHWALSCREV